MLIAAAGAALFAASTASAESADYYRGGWRTDSDDPHVYEFVIDGSQVSGVYCTRCADGTTLARIVGNFDPASGIDFTIRHLRLDGSLGWADHLKAKLAGPKLVISGKNGASGNTIRQELVKDARGPTPSSYPQTMLPPGSPPVKVVEPNNRPSAPPPPYVQPAPWRQLTADDVLGVWLGFGVGKNKQYFLIREDEGLLFGLACGPCDNPYTMGALENFTIRGDTLQFDIEHQDWGAGDHVPFVRHVTAHIAMNEMRIDARHTDMPGERGIIASLVGPIAIEATAGNVIGEPESR